MKTRNLFVGLFAVIAVFAFTSTSFAQSLSVDPGFRPVPTKNSEGPSVVYPLSNGKYIIYGAFGGINGEVRGSIARLNADFSLDTSFNCNRCSIVSGVVEQPDGKLLVYGSVLNSTGSVPGIRINIDGSYDPTFTWPFPPSTPVGPFTLYYFAGVQPDGKILAVSYSNIITNRFNSLHRLNPDGSLDPSFTTYTIGTASGGRGAFTQITPLPDGKIMIAGSETLTRLNSNGTIDSSFIRPAFLDNSGPSNVRIYKFDFQSDGKIIAVGNFISVNGIPTPSKIVRINTDQGVDLTYNPPLNTLNSTISFLKFQNDKIVVLVDSLICCVTPPRLFKFNTDGTTDTGFTPPPNMTQTDQLIKLDSQDRMIVKGSFTGDGNRYARLQSNGVFDSYFAPLNTGSLAPIYAIAAQADGKAIIAGEFDKVNDVPRGSIARVNPDGAIDPAFLNSGSGFSGIPSALAIQPDGKILAAGGFSSYNGTSVGFLIRINTDGSLDGSFSPIFNSSGIRSIAIQPDGKIIVGGSFGAVNGVGRAGIIRLNPNGTTDTSFTTITTASVQAVLLQPDGKVMMGGSFTGVNGFPRSNLVRLNADGTLDNTFNAGSITPVSAISRISNGKYFVNTGQITKLNTDGTTDGSFNLSHNGTVAKMLAFDDGSLIIGGSFTAINSVNSRINIARINPDGSPDSSLTPHGSNGIIRDLALQPDGKVLAGGDFNIIGGESRLAVARLSVSSTPLAPQAKRFDFDGDGKADIAVYRSSNNTWYIFKSGSGQLEFHNFGLGGDILTPADFDGDQKFDLSIFRPSTGFTWFREVTTGNYNGTQFGASGDIPVHSDYTGDGKADYVVFRPSNGVWYRYDRINNQTSIIQFGANGDIPVIADFDGDGKSDLAVFRPSLGDWYWMNSSNGQFFGYHFGAPGDLTVPADYDGDGKTDLAVYRPSDGGWYRILSGNGQFASTQFGISTDKPIPADYDGDGKADIGVFRQGLWIILNSQSGGITGFQFGVPTDDPVPNAYVR